MQEITVEVVRIVSDLSARVYRRPDAECPDGQWYGLQLDVVRDTNDHRASVALGSQLVVTLSEMDAGSIERARLATPAAFSVHQFVTA